MARTASSFRLDPNVQARLAHLSRVLHRPMNQLVNKAVEAFVEVQSAEVERDLESTLTALRAYRKRDPHFREAIAAAVEAEATLGKDDPAEGKIHRGKLVNGKLIETSTEEISSAIQSEIDRLLNAS